MGSVEARRVNWSAFIEITGSTPIERTDIVINILEDLALSLCGVDANLRMILLADDKKMEASIKENLPAKEGSVRTNEQAHDERGSD